MIQDVLLLAGALLLVIAMGVFLFALLRAPEGSEDETGFHYRKRGSPASKPPFASTGSRIRAKKNKRAVKFHIPAV